MTFLQFYKHGSNYGALGFVGWYAYQYATAPTPPNNHIYIVYSLFPIIAATGITVAMWSLPDTSKQRVLYLVGLFTLGWLV